MNITLKFIHKITICLGICATMSGALKAESVYNSADVRFTLVTPRVVRLEYAPDGKFVEDKSFLATEREKHHVDVKVSHKHGWVIIRTTDLELKYKENSGMFTPSNLSVKSLRSDVNFVWHPGMQQIQNLKGTYRTLDGYDGNSNTYDNGTPMPIEDGLLSKDGWTLLDDSQSLLFDNDPEWEWFKLRDSSPEAQDWYFMVYGHDYKQALTDFTVFAGKIPLPPRFAFGYWWSRYWCYSDNEIREVVDNFKSYDIPIDVFTLDMDWHYTEEGKGGWSGYTWNRNLFPNPEGLIKHLKSNDLQVTMNLHPADGIRTFEEQYPAMKMAMGYPVDYNKDIPIYVSDKNFMNAWFETVLHPMERWGVDFWWLDWQQHIFDPKVENLHNTWWLNYCFFSDHDRDSTLTARPLLYHRWGGLGNHRYPIGFSGDSSITWNSLDFQPYFNSTASNVLYGYWSHDIGGHHFGIGRIEPEMFVRWMQFGVMSPILRTHSTKNENLKKEPWSFDQEYFKIIRNLIKQRYELSPYIYTMARVAYDTGVSICRPMYYDYPENDEAYVMKNQYMFGNQILVMPITQPMGDDERYSEALIWLPEGNQWYELSTGTMLEGGQTITRRFAIDESPVYIKAGSVIPMSYGLKNLRSNDAPYEINVYPGGNGQCDIYEDAGNEKDYDVNYAMTHVSSELNGHNLRVTINPRRGSYNGMPITRQVRIKVNGYAVPLSIKVDNRKVNGIYDGNTQSLLVDIENYSPDYTHVVEIIYPETGMLAPNGIIGKFHRINKAMVAMKYRHATMLFTDPFARLESTGRAITYNPALYNELVERFASDYSNLREIVNDLDTSEENRTWFLREIDYDNIR